MQTTQAPFALFVSSLAYLYNSVNNGGPIPMIPNNRNSTLVDTNYGILRGLKPISRNGRTYYSFRGIPYASPPLGDLRFEPPEPPSKWGGIRDATRYGAQCAQMNIITRLTITGEESCLFLNVYTHKIWSKKDVKHASLDPVIVFIHGGLFMSGSSNIYRPKYFMDEDVVLVTLNYRLGSFGFLNTGDGVVRGNMGLKDQTMALRWVQENIMYLGGDPNRVTIMGESAGAAASHLHTLSPLSKGLFHRAISMSGSSLSPWGLIDNPQSQAKEYAENVGCPSDNTTLMVRCLKSLDSNIITRSHFGYINALANNKQSVFGPTVEAVVDNTTFLSATPIELMRSGQINPVPWMTGVNSEEGLVYLIPIIRNSTMNRLINENWESYAAKFLNIPPSEVNPELLKDIRKFYLNDSEVGLPTLKKSADMISDRAFFLDNHDASVLHSRVADVYPYFYKYNGKYAMAKLLFVKGPLPFRIPDYFNFALGTASTWFAEYVFGIREPNYFGVGHSDEIVLFFNAPFIRREVVPEDVDYIFSKTLISLWVSFAETGVPNTRSLHLPTWNPLRNVEDGNHTLKRYILDENPKMDEEPFFERLQFWKTRNITYV